MDTAPEKVEFPAERFARLITAADGPDGGWSPTELGGVLAHQLRAPLEFELEGSRADDVPIARPNSGSSVKCFADLFGQPSPPLELLLLTKDFAKMHLSHPETTLVVEVAQVLYYASIALALVRLGTRITQLGNAELSRGMQWCLAQPWMDPQLRSVFSAAVAYLNTGAQPA